MIHRRLFLLASVALTVPLVLASAPLATASQRTTLVIVTQKTSALEDISVRELKRMYTGDQVTGPNGSALIPLNHGPGSAVRVAFERLVLKMSPDEVGRFWIDRKIRGQTGGPKVVPSVELLRRVVATLPNTLAYISASDVTAELKVLTVDGKSPAAPDYPLHAE